MKKCNVLMVFAIVASVGFTGIAQADMLGDQLTIERFYPDLNTSFRDPVSTIVVAGDSDGITSHGHAVFNPEATSIFIDYQNSSSYVENTFDGYRFTGFSKDIQSVIATNVTNVAIEELAFGQDFITLNLAGEFDSTSFIELQINFEQPSSNNDNCRATYTSGALHIPCVDVQLPFGGTVTYEVNMQHQQNSNPMSFGLTGATEK
ncbi:hypothetical protein QUF61_06320 [Candidatus Venteria ishoeyi]|uniref:hypothetical protein n=1 Tax=Candidatus Venteria ishoeyi TaxID=1899563 RepID=UPI0025A57FC9|nr:hypothetical protein [Candidatus Venteria ishoeyi]MDM8546091.1 hypothetical protein [Candidatus Venteria ishoeyi]